MEIWISLVLGLVQGLTEFIPVSSSGHLELVQQIIGGRGEDFHYFLELINIGTLLALLIYYRKRIVEIIKDIFVKKHYRLAVNIIITCIPAGLAGLLLSDFIDENPFFSSLFTVASAMAIVGFLMVIVDHLPHAKEISSEKKLSPWKALWIGLAQVCALIPGVSRSGSTIIAGRIAGMNSKSSADYSFLVSIPLMSAVCLKTLVSSSTREYLMNNIGVIAAGNGVAFVSGLIAIFVVMKYLKKKNSLRAFGYYRMIIGLGTLVYLLAF